MSHNANETMDRRKMATSLQTATRPRFLAALSLVLLGTAACASKPDVTGSIPADYHDRHPIVLVNAEQGMDIYIGMNHGRLGERQLSDIRALSRDFLKYGKGPLTALVPVTPGRDIASHQGLAAVRQALAGSGVSGNYLMVQTYRAEGNPGEHPIRLVYTKLKAQVTTRCGQWPADLGGAGEVLGSNNEPYYNHGCAMQQMLAVQTADPLDLVRPRAEDPVDTNRRIHVIDTARQGKDPSTEYRAKGIVVNQAVGGGSN